VKLHRVGVDDNVERNVYLEDRPDSKHRTEFADGHFSHYVFDFLTCYISHLQICSKLLYNSALYQNSTKIIVITDSDPLSCFEIQIKHFNIHAELPNTNSVFSHHSVVADVKQVHCQASDMSLGHSDDAMAAKIVRCQFVVRPICGDSCHEPLVGLYRF
jgi:hypothetical protein